MDETKTRPSGERGSLESHSLEILALFKQGKSFRNISEWLALPPRGLTISRQAIHQWVRSRLQKMNSRVELMGAAAAFTSAEVRSPTFCDAEAALQQNAAEASMPLETASNCRPETVLSSPDSSFDPRKGPRPDAPLVLTPAPMPLIYRVQPTAGMDKDKEARSLKTADMMRAIILKNDEVKDQSQAELQATADRVIRRS